MSLEIEVGSFYFVKGLDMNCRPVEAVVLVEGKKEDGRFVTVFCSKSKVVKKNSFRVLLGKEQFLRAA